MISILKRLAAAAGAAVIVVATSHSVLAAGAPETNAAARSDSANVAMVKGAYAAFARGDVPAVLAIMSPTMVWREAEGGPYADRNPYVGPQAVAQGLFARLGGDWDGFSLQIDEILDAGDTVIARGRYHGAYKATGKRVDAQFAHVWTFAGGKVVKFDQYTDTAQWTRAVTP